MDFSAPKVDLTVNLSEVAIELNKAQVSACVLSKTCLSQSATLVSCIRDKDQNKFNSEMTELLRSVLICNY